MTGTKSNPDDTELVVGMEDIFQNYPSCVKSALAILKEVLKQQEGGELPGYSEAYLKEKFDSILGAVKHDK